MYEAFDKLLGEIFAGEIALWNFSCGQEFVKGYCLRSKWDRWLLLSAHVGITTAGNWETSTCTSNSTGPPDARQVYRRGRQRLSRKTGEKYLGSQRRGGAPEGTPPL